MQNEITAEGLHRPAANRRYGVRRSLRSSEKVSLVALLGISAICLWNLNGLFAMWLRSNQVFSAVILVLGLTVLLVGRVPIARSLGAMGAWFAGFMIVYLTLGFLVQQDFGLLFSYSASIFLVSVSAVGFFVLFSVFEKAFAFLFLAVLALAGAMSVFLSPWMGPIYANMETTRLVSAAGRWSGFFANPNETAMACAYALCFALSAWLFSKRSFVIRAFLAGSICFTTVGVLLTFSRGGMITYACIFVIFILGSSRISGRGIKLAVVFGAACIVVGGWFFLVGYKLFEWTVEQERRIGSVASILYERDATSRDYGGRTSGVKAGIDYWLESPVVGNGLGSMHFMPYRYFRGLGCHNTHIMILGEVGLVGAAFYIAFWIAWVTAILKCGCSKLKLCLIMLAFAIFMNGMVGHTMLENRNVNLILGVVIGVLSVERWIIVQDRRRAKTIDRVKNPGPGSTGRTHAGLVLARRCSRS